MNSKARMAAAMRHEIPDRVPVMCQLALGHYFLNMRDKWKPHAIWFSSEAFADSLVTLCQRYRFDGILINIPGRDPNWMDTVVSITETPEGEILRLKDDTAILVPWDDNAQYEPGRLDHIPYADFAGFDPDKDMDRLNMFPRYTFGIYHVPYLTGTSPGLPLKPPEYFFRTIDMVKNAVGNSVSVHGEIFSPFTHYMELFGYQEGLLGLVTDAEKAETILERFTEAAAAWGLAQAGRGVDAVLISSAFAGGGFISPEMYKRFVVPFERKVVDAIHAAYPETPVYTHTCGKLADRLELLAQSNTDGIDTLDPPPLGNTDLADAKMRIGDRLFIKGNMDSVGILSDTREQFTQRVINTLQTGKPGGGYILSTACSVAPHVEPWKLELLVDLAETYGQYD